MYYNSPAELNASLKSAAEVEYYEVTKFPIMEGDQMTTNYAKEGTYQGESAVLLKFGRYSAVLLPRIGSNLISFRDDENDYQLLREPKEEEFASFVERPMIHGIPVLFPPNRFDGGRFTFNGRDYVFPVNEPATGNHLHGFVYNCPWEVKSFGTDATSSYVTAILRFDEQHPSYVYFPHTFTLSLTYILTEEGLTQTFSAHNEGPDELPFMLGYHTAVNAPFAPGSTIEDIDVLLTIGERWQLGGRMLPTGQSQALDAGEQALKSGAGNPYYADMDNHYSSVPQDGRNIMVLTDNKAKVRLVYDAGLKYKHWMVWNNQSNGKFFCPEPQTNLVNAPNSTLPAEVSGLFGLKSGEVWSETSRMYVESI
jgi:aldose 1-epimerase